MYPVETIFAEKLETIISKGAANSRMKDYHDVLLLCRKDGLLSVGKLKKDIAKTFQNRKTKLEIPIQFTEDNYTLMQQLWAGHRRGLEKIAEAPSRGSGGMPLSSIWVPACRCWVCVQ